MSKNKNNKYLNNNENLPIHVEIDWTPENIAEFKRCKEDVIYFAENYFYIVNLDEGQQKIKLYQPQKEAILEIVNSRRTVICASRQVGKALDINTPIPTPDGWKKMGELKDGDRVFDENGKICTIIKAHDIRVDRKCYEITFSNGEKIIADESHEWFTQNNSERRKGKDGSNKTTDEIYKTLTKGKTTKEPNHRILFNSKVEYPSKKLSIDPYLLGYWLGDGFSNGSRIIVGKQDIENVLLNFEYIKNKSITFFPYKNCFHINILKDDENISFKTKLKNYNLLNNKHIPIDFLLSDYNQRLELLRGLMDSNGHCNKRGVCQFYSINKELAENVKELIYSLGIQCSITSKIPKLYNKECKRIYMVTFSTTEKIFKINRKSENQKKILNKNSRNNYIYIKNIIEIDSTPVRCISVDSKSNLFLCGKTFIPTHNSTLMTIVCLWYSLFVKNFNVAILANKEDQAKEILERIKLAYEEIPNWLKSGVEDFTKEHIKFKNRSKIFVSTTSADAIRGKSVNLLFIDEFAHVRKEIADDFFKSIIPTLSSSKKSKLVIVSTPKGTENRFYDIFNNAVNGKSNWAWVKIYWHQIPGRDEAWKKEQLEAISYDMEMWNQEFDIQFLEDGTAALNLKLIEKLKNMCKKPKFVFENGDYILYKEPELGKIYTIGVDVAEGVGQDYSVAHILDITDPLNIDHCGTYATNKIQPYVFAEKLNQIARSWGRPFLCIERNKEGGQVVDALWEVHRYDNIIQYTMKNDKRGVYQNLGIFCHQNSKYTGIMNLKYYMEHLEALSLYDMTTVREFETFVRKENKTWSAKKGYRDDRVMALVWAMILLEKDIAETYLDVLEYDDSGKPIRILDPNAHLAENALMNNGKSGFEKSGTHPSFAFINRGSSESTQQSIDMDTFMGTGWRLVT